MTFNKRRNESGNLSGMQYLIGKEWKTFSVSPLNRFENTPSMLNICSHQLKKYLTDMKSNSAGFRYSVALSEVAGIAQTEHDASAFKLEVTAILGINAQKVYVGLMMCRGTEKPLNLSAANMVHLPVLFCRGPVNAVKLVHDGLEKLFDCTISPLYMAEEELLWCYAIQCEWQLTKRSDSTVNITFTVPNLIVMNSYTVKLPISSSKVQLSALHKNESHEEVKRFREYLDQYAYYCGLNVNATKMTTVATPSLTVTHEGHIKVTVLEVMGKILPFLCNIATMLDRLNIACLTYKGE